MKTDTYFGKIQIREKIQQLEGFELITSRFLGEGSIPVSYRDFIYTEQMLEFLFRPNLTREGIADRCGSFQKSWGGEFKSHTFFTLFNFFIISVYLHYLFINLTDTPHIIWRDFVIKQHVFETFRFFLRIFAILSHISQIEVWKLIR